jgi:tetratricopeptide (TPR) repeat protein
MARDLEIMRWPIRAFVAMLIVVLAGLASLLWRAPMAWLQPSKLLSFPGHVAAAAAQQGAPTTAAELLASIDHDLAIAQARAAKSINAWSDRAQVGSLLMARARLKGSFEDYRDAGHAFDAAFAVAAPGTGPHLERAGFNFAVHRLSAMAPDLAAVDHYVIPDAGNKAAVLELRGDIAFYTGHYAAAKALYDKSRATMPTVAANAKLANWYWRMGDDTRAMASLDAADRGIGGPQQQLHAFIELRRGLIDLSRGRWPEAEARFRRADDMFPGWWVIEEQLATVRALRGAPDEAMAIFRRMAARDAQPDAYDGIAGLYRAQGDFPNAQAAAAKAGAMWDARLALLPEAALGHAIDHLLAFGDPAQALAAAQRNYALRPYGDAATALAAAYLANHRAADALAVLRPLFAVGWASAEPHIIASEAYALLGQGKQADAERQAALAINPRSLDRNPGMTWLEQ